MTETLAELAGRVEALTGADRGVDLEIGRIFGVTVWKHDAENRHNYETTNWHYTASLDDAMSLAEPSWWLRLGGPLSPAAYGYSREEDRVFRAGFDMMEPPYSVGATGATLALALTAACLRARSATSRGEG